MSVSADRSVLERLRSDLQGTLVLEGDADYDTARLPWNLAVDQRPAAIATPAPTRRSASTAPGSSGSRAPTPR